MSFLLQYHFTTGEESDPNNCYDWWSCLSLSAQHTLADVPQRLEMGRKGSIPPETEEELPSTSFPRMGLGAGLQWQRLLGTCAPKATCWCTGWSYGLHLCTMQKNSLSLKSCNSAPHHCYYMHSYLAVLSICLFKFLAIWTLLKSWNCNCSDH